MKKRSKRELAGEREPRERSRSVDEIYLSQMPRRWTPEEEAALGDTIIAYQGVIAECLKGTLRPDGIEPAIRLDLLSRATSALFHTRKALVEGNLRLVIAVWKRVQRRAYTKNPGTMSDSIQAGNIGLITAAGTYDPTRGKFSTWAWLHIENALKRGRESHRIIKLPRRWRDHLGKIEAAKEAFARREKREPTLHDLAAETGMTTTEIEQIQRAVQQPLSLGSDFLAAPSTANGQPVDFSANLIPSHDPTPAESLEHTALEDGVTALLDALPKREREVLTLRYLGEAISYAEIGRRIGGGRSGKGLGRTRVQELERQALARLRAQPKARVLLAALLERDAR